MLRPMTPFSPPIAPNWIQERRIFRARVTFYALFVLTYATGILNLSLPVFALIVGVCALLVAANIVGIRQRWVSLPTLNLAADQVSTLVLLAISGGAAGPFVSLCYLHMISAIVFFGSMRVVVPLGVLQVVNLAVASTVIVQTGGEPAWASVIVHSLVLMVIAFFFAKPAATLHDDARRDPLTGALNRRFGLRELENWLLDGKPFSLLFADMKQFKAVNDRHGHAVGDEVLAQVTRLITESVRDNDMVVRYGGDEFLIATRGEAAVVATRLHKAFAQPLTTSAGELHAQVDFGTAHFPDDAAALSDLIAAADKQMFDVKQASGTAAIPGSR